MTEYRILKDRKNENGRVLNKRNGMNGKIGFFDKKTNKEAIELFNSLPVMMLIGEKDVEVVFEKSNFFIFTMEISALKEYAERVAEDERNRKKRMAEEKAERQRREEIEKRVKEIEDDPNFQIIPEFKKVSTRYLGIQVKKVLEENGIKKRNIMFDEYTWGEHIIKIPYEVVEGEYFREKGEYRISVYPEDLTQKISDLESEIKWGLHREVLKLHGDERSDRELMFASGFTLHQEGKRTYWTGSVSVGESSDGYRAARTIDQEVSIVDAVDKLYPGERAELTEKAEKELEELKSQPPLKEVVLSPIPEGYEVLPNYRWDDEIRKALLNGIIS